jgi:hypothetical protein
MRFPELLLFVKWVLAMCGRKLQTDLGDAIVWKLSAL